MSEGIQTNIISGLNLAKVTLIACVPTSGLDKVYSHFESLDRCIFATREDEAMAIVAGMTMTNSVGAALVIQQSGIGNLLNTMFTLVECYDIYFPILVYDRGGGDVNPVHWISSRNSWAAVSAIYKPERIDFNAPNSNHLLSKAINRKVRWIFTA